MITVYVPNLFFSMKVVDVLKKLGKDFEIKNSAPESYDWLIIDLSAPSAMETVKKNPKKTICFVSHMKTDLITEATELGCEHIYSNGQFSTQAMEILAEIN